jgi:rubredoxin
MMQAQQCPECGSRHTALVAFDEVITCLDCGEYFDDELPTPEQRRKPPRKFKKEHDAEG